MECRLIGIQKYADNQCVSCAVQAVREAALCLDVDDMPLVRLACTGQDPESLALGFLFSCGMIRCAADVAQMHVTPHAGGWDVRVRRMAAGDGLPCMPGVGLREGGRITAGPEDTMGTASRGAANMPLPAHAAGRGDAAPEDAGVENTDTKDAGMAVPEVRAAGAPLSGLPPLTVTSGLGRHFALPPETLPPLPRPERPLWPLVQLRALAGEFFARCGLYQRTRGCHNACLCDAGGIRFFQEDIGRHNALDTIVGQCLRGGVDTRACAVISTGRVATEIVQKAVRAGIPLLMASAVATAGAVDMARDLGLALVGNAGGEELWIYHDNGVLLW